MKLKELEDFDWFPPMLRKYQMELIGILVSQFGFYHQVVKMIKRDLIKFNKAHITDLCSGSGLPAIYVHQKLTVSNLQSTLTDKFPQQISGIEGVEYLTTSVDVNDLEPEAHTYYTMFNAFHHLEYNERRQLIQKVLDNNSHLIIVEIVQPTFINVILVTLASTVGVWLLCPFIKPFDWKRLFFTYIIPLNVLTVLIDGYISILKSKTKNQYRSEFTTMFNDLSRIEISSHLSFPAYLVTIKVSPSHV
ncbi:MAG TPA: hypothetical protein PKD51_06370 [Saprospiraceae bacterium]|nr:hypothetical protein [Saprospiraceae bacterium]